MRLETKRLAMRELTKKDLDVLFELLKDPNVMYNLEGVYDIDETKEYLEDYCIDNKSTLAIIEKSSSSFVGIVRFYGGDDNDSVRKITWVTHQRFWRRGFAYEIGTTILDYGFKTMGLKKIYAQIEDTASSIGLLEKLGMTKEARLRQHHYKPDTDTWIDGLFFGILNDEYAKPRLQKR